MMVAAYLETLSTYSPSVLAEACDTFRKRSTRFAPSAGEIYDRCAEIQHRETKAARMRLAAPTLDEPEYNQEHREEMQRKIAALLAELKSGANFNPHYGRIR